MRRPVCIHEKHALAAHLGRRPDLHLYELGDLDEFFWPHTSWYALQGELGIEESVLVYSGTDLPVLIAMAEEPVGCMRELLASVRTRLPARCYAHLTPGLIDLLDRDYRAEPHGVHVRMRLAHPEIASGIDPRDAAPLGSRDLPDLLDLYRTAYPGNWFDPRMLDTGAYHGIRRGGKLVGAGGVHVHSPAYRVAALGNITTHPDARGQGIATAVTAAVCRNLLADADRIGLNVHAENTAAIRCYERLGFERCAVYHEYMLEWKR